MLLPKIIACFSQNKNHWFNANGFYLRFKEGTYWAFLA
jgi:hypothetical protein